MQFISSTYCTSHACEVVSSKRRARKYFVPHLEFDGTYNISMYLELFVLTLPQSFKVALNKRLIALNRGCLKFF